MNKKAKFDIYIFLMGLLIFIFCWNLLEAVGSDMIETGEKVPCLDERNREFEDELCYEKISCSNLEFSLYATLSKFEYCDNIHNSKENTERGVGVEND